MLSSSEFRKDKYMGCSGVRGGICNRCDKVLRCEGGSSDCTRRVVRASCMLCPSEVRTFLPRGINVVRGAGWNSDPVELWLLRCGIPWG